MSALYTASATSTGDARSGGNTRSSDGILNIDMAIPTEMGGSGKGSNPEQLFAAGYATCFHSAVKLVAGQMKAPITDSAVTADVNLFPTDEGGFLLGVALHVELGNVDQQTADAIVEKAHQVCPYSNATRGNIEVTVDVEVG
ncbi:organic hydroperoxide resistance protein [Okibacterium fritillariae]|jgi:osmotically inducible protein OsmC|uniref:organic hydroperoxide resistance protein n=1 Tax=Okibacterium fritillariae TaxID=123320 RepID=UPI004055710F